MSDNSKELVFVQARPADIDAVMQIENESFTQGVREEKAVFLDRIKTFSEGFLLAKDTKSGEIGGYISCEIWNRSRPLTEKSFTVGHLASEAHDKNGSRLYLASFGTLKSWRGLKVGNALFKELDNRIEKDFPNVTEKFLIVSEKWEIARHIYQKSGYDEVKILRDFFTPQDAPCENGVIMVKKR